MAYAWRATPNIRHQAEEGQLLGLYTRIKSSLAVTILPCLNSSDRDGSAVKFTADETVPRMNDTTNEELKYYKTHSFWNNDFLEIKTDHSAYYWRI